MSTRAELRAATRRRVVASARKLFESEGFEATTVRAIAADAGVSVGTVMSVGDKRALLVEVFDDAIRAVHDARSPSGIGPLAPPDAGTGAAPAAVHDDPRALVARILALLDPFVAVFSAHTDLARTYAAALVSGRHTSTVFGEPRTVLVGEIAAVLADAVPGAGSDAAPDARAVPPAAPDVDAAPAAPGVDALARSAYLVYIGALFEWAAGPDPDPEALAASISGALLPLMPTPRKEDR